MITNNHPSTTRVTTLPNGLRVATDTIPGSQTVSLGIWTNCGARNEKAPVNGVAHLLEHMLFKGTPRRSAKAIAEEMEAVGGQMNAYTSRENTAYYARVLKEHAGLALDILADILQFSLFDEAELMRERQVVVQEIGQTMDTPDDIVFDYFQETAFPGQPLGRPILGTRETVEAMTQDNLRAYIREQYAAERLVVVAAGGVEHDWLVEQAARLFHALPKNAVPGMAPAAYRGGDFRKSSELEQVHLVLGFDGIGFHDPDYYAAQVLSTALGGGMSSRLFQEIREKRGLVYSIQSFAADYKDGGLFGVYAGTGAERLNELVPVLCEELAKSTLGFEEAEIMRARAQIKSSLLLGLESSFNRAETLALSLLMYDRPIPIEETMARIDAVDNEALIRTARRVTTSEPTVTAMGALETLDTYERINDRLKTAA
jgi:predicted Zn-dependent peptidase